LEYYVPVPGVYDTYYNLIDKDAKLLSPWFNSATRCEDKNKEEVWYIKIKGKGNLVKNGKILSDIQQYNPRNDTWVHVGNLPNGGLFNHIAFNIGGRIYVGLGEDENFNMNNRLYCIHEK
jgi:hypothetical protein